MIQMNRPHVHQDIAEQEPSNVKIQIVCLQQQFVMESMIVR